MSACAPNSVRAKLVANTCVPISRCDIAAAIVSRSMPRSRKISTVRWFVMCARGESAVPACFVTVMASTPWSASSAAAVNPAGPAPTIRTSVSMPASTHSSLGDLIAVCRRS
jgi:hypothetical protein